MFIFDSRKINKKVTLSLIAVALSIYLPQQQCHAGFGNIFNGSNPQGSALPPTPPGAIGSVDDTEPGPSKTNISSPTNTAGNTDLSDDEKRMKQKYREKLARAKSLIDKGEKMMKSCGDRHDDKNYKRGKIYKEIGEHNLADLKANSPFPAGLDDNPKKPKPDSL